MALLPPLMVLLEVYLLRSVIGASASPPPAIAVLVLVPIVLGILALIVSIFRFFRRLWRDRG